MVGDYGPSPDLDRSIPVQACTASSHGPLFAYGWIQLYFLEVTCGRTASDASVELQPRHATIYAPSFDLWSRRIATTHG